MDHHNHCDCCGSFLANCRLIAGGVKDRRQFCSFVCYDRWREGKEMPALRARLRKPIELRLTSLPKLNARY